MARRKAGVPESARFEIAERAASGTGHDSSFPTEGSPGQFGTADAALTGGPPSAAMLRRAKEVVDWLRAQGAEHVDCVQDVRREIRPGGLVVMWSGEPMTRAAAEQFAVSRDDTGLPLLPAWLSFRVDGDFDLRWQHSI